MVARTPVLGRVAAEGQLVTRLRVSSGARSRVPAMRGVSGSSGRPAPSPAGSAEGLREQSLAPSVRAALRAAWPVTVPPAAAPAPCHLPALLRGSPLCPDRPGVAAGVRGPPAHPPQRGSSFPAFVLLRFGEGLPATAEPAGGQGPPGKAPLETLLLRSEVFCPSPPSAPSLLQRRPGVGRALTAGLPCPRKPSLRGRLAWPGPRPGCCWVLSPEEPRPGRAGLPRGAEAREAKSLWVPRPDPRPSACTPHGTWPRRGRAPVF